MAPASFDLDYGLSQPANHENLQQHNIPPSIENEALALEPPRPPGPQNPHDRVPVLDAAFRNFQRVDRERFGNFIRHEPAYDRLELGPEDYHWDQGEEDEDYSDQDEEDESMDPNPEDEIMNQLDSGEVESMMEDPPPSGEPNPRASPDPQEQVQHDRAQHQSSIYERRLIAEDQVNVYLENPVDQDYEISFGVNMEPIQEESPIGMDRPAILEELPPMEERFTNELSTQIGPFLSEESAGLTPAASPSPATHLMPNTSDAATDLVICESSLERIITSPGIDQIRITDGASVNLEAAADGSGILADDQESVKTMTELQE